MAFPLRFRCLVCQHDAYDNLGGVLRQCRNCGLATQFKPPESPTKLYSRDAYDAHRQEVSHQPPAWMRFWHDYAVGVDRMLQLENLVPSGGTWVDFGCGNGGLLAAARDAGYDPLGVELDAQFCQEILINTGISVCQTSAFFSNPQGTSACSSSMVQPNGSTVVSLFDVLEHLVDPVGSLTRLISSVELVRQEAGWVVIEVPDFDQCPPDVAKWKHLRPNEHLTHWSEDPLDIVGAKLGYESREYQRPVEGKLQAVWSDRT